AAYTEALGPAAGVTVDDVREGVRRQSFFGVLMSIVSPMLVERTERGDQMFMAMIARHCQHVLDTDALAILPPPTRPEPLRPGAEDEDSHPPGDEPLWSESWYFDFADLRQDVGGWIRLGLIPNQGHAWINALLCGPGMPTVAVLDFEVALPDDHTRVRTHDAEVRTEVVEPLRTFRVTVRAQGQAYDDPAALLRGEAGRPVAVDFDLTWSTDGVPYQYRVSPRYEIPCRVTGSVTADGRTTALARVQGQRDHSWAPRDWWAMDWVWSALHLDDGTHLHGVDIRIPGMPPLAVGYLQQPGQPLVELEHIATNATFAPDGLPLTAQLGFGDLAVDITLRGHAPVLLSSPDGRLSRFPRAWGTVETPD
ncbi:MAG: phosphotransferase, partial [Mycobacterium sp.]|nr:phosphotransferase [Mycobacterium sp.]